MLIFAFSEEDETWVDVFFFMKWNTQKINEQVFEWNPAKNGPRMNKDHFTTNIFIWFIIIDVGADQHTTLL